MENRTISFLEDYNTRTDRWWFYNYLGREIQIIGSIICFGERKKSNGKIGKTILLKDIFRIDDFGNLIQTDYCDHLWIPLTKKLNNVQIGAKLSIIGKVRVYESADQKSFGLKKIRKCKLII